ncbi:MAG: phosphodiester glycosidase family protein [Armatimonadetes bacterium]|nr:phosphodiester glycosidase family protein [Armatimonadota bacterium]
MSLLLRACCSTRGIGLADRAILRCALAFIILSLAVPSVSAPVSKVLADGVTLVQDIETDSESPLIVNVLRIDPKRPGVKIAAALAGDKVITDGPAKGRETVSSMVARKGALAGVNADYFPYTGDPLGLAIIDAELVSEPMDRAAIGITADGSLLCDRVSFSGRCTAVSGAQFSISGLNRTRQKDELVLYTPAFGAAVANKEGVEVALLMDGPVRPNVDITATVVTDPASCAGLPVPDGHAILSASGSASDWVLQNFHKDEKITLRFDVRSASGRSWDSVVNAVGGGPWLVRGGSVMVDTEEQGFKPTFSLFCHPRTAAGITASGELLLVAVDGRQCVSRGMTLPEMAELLKKLGAVEAINLDGGGSTSLSVMGLVINSPSGGKERPVANALLVYAQPTLSQDVAFSLAESGCAETPSGQGRLLTLIDGASGQPVPEEAQAGILWGTTGGIGFVDQKGYFMPIKAGKGTVTALGAGRRFDLPITVVPGKPVKLWAKLVQDPSGAPNRGQVDVTLRDPNGNGIAGQAILLSVRGGIADYISTVTDSTGAASFGITWDSTAKAATISVSVAGMSAKVQ